jgi:anti-sigma factor RsiW
MTKDISCYQAVALVSDYLEGALSWRDRRRLERHLEGCDACSAYLEQMREIIDLCGEVGPEDLSDEAVARLVDVFEKYQRDTSNGSAD